MTCSTMQPATKARLVLDNNQAQLPALRAAIAHWRPDAIVVPPLVLAEILLRRGSRRLLQELVDVRAVLGMQFLHVFDVIAELDAPRITAFQPFELATGLTLAEVISHEAPRQWARQVKEENRQSLEGLRTLAKGARARLVAAKEPRLHSMEEAEGKIDGLDAEWVAVVTAGGKRRARLEEAALVAAMRTNPYLTRFFRAMLAYMLCISGAWDQQSFRGIGVDFSPGGGGSEDDWTDVSLFLYAGEGDVILSADHRVRDLARISDPRAGVRVWSAPVPGGRA